MSNRLQALVKNADPFEGVYRLRRPVWSWTREGKPFIRLALEDVHGSIPAYIWEPTSEIDLPRDLSCVQVRGVMRTRRDGVVAEVQKLQAGERNPEDLVRLIPRSLCPLPWLMPLLEAIVGRIQTFCLKQFLFEVLSDDSIAFPFVSCPASLRYHHNYPGGLLRHSLECAQIVERYREFPVNSKDLGVIAALMHDIGKILTMTPQMRRTTLGRTLDHDKLTLELLAPYLRRLDERWAEGAAQLRYLMTWRPGQRDPGIPRTPLANVVLGADRVSAGIDERGGPEYAPVLPFRQHPSRRLTCSGGEV